MSHNALITPGSGGGTKASSKPSPSASAINDADSYSANGETPSVDLAALRAAKEDWRKNAVAKAEAKIPPRKQRFSTWSDLEVPDLLTPADVPLDYMKDLGLPGNFPFTRGVQPTMYRGRLWTMRMFAGFGTPAQT